MGTLVLVLAALAVAGTGALAACCVRLTSPVGFLLAAYLFGSAEVVAVSLLLSPGRRLTEGALLAAIAALALAAAVAWLALGRPRPPLGHETGAAVVDALRDPVVLVLALVAAATYAYVLVVGLTVPQSLPDTLLYHLPRAALWKQQHAVAYVAASPDQRIDAFPPNAEIEVAVSMILGRSDRFVALVQLGSVVAASLAVVGIARRLGLSGPAAAFGALAFATFTVVVLQAPTALNDLVVACFLVVAAFFATGTTRRELALGSLALALAVGTKGTVAFALPALAAFALAAQPRRRWPALAVFGAGGLLAGAYWFGVNLVETGAPSGGTALGRGGQPFLDRVGRSAADLLELTNQEGDGPLASPVWGGAAFAACALAATILALRRRTAAAGWVLLAGVVSLFAAPLLVTWSGIAYRVGVHALSAVGLSTAKLSRLPSGFYESPMHSSYGLAFVLLFFSACALLAVDSRRRPASTAALAAVPVTLVMSALLLAYDPQRMRYLAFGVALASAVFGVVLRVRPLAWVATGLACVNALVLVAYFVPRPAGLALLPGNRGGETAARWFVQGGSGNGDPEAFRFLEQQVPNDATIALALRRNTYVYPAWDAGLRRTVVFVPRDGAVPSSARWLVVGPREELRVPAGWRLALASTGGWRIYRRLG